MPKRRAVAEVLNILLLLLAIVLLIPVAVVCLECILSLLPVARGTGVNGAHRPRLAVLVPAHDEQAAISSTLRNLCRQLRPGDRALVVADNCSDRTAELARESGATVVQRTDPHRRGKGYALDAGVQALADDPPEVLIVVDADCQLAWGALDALAHQARATGAPAQGAYLLRPPADSSPRDLVSALAFAVKNLVRPLGLQRIGMPCLLTGTGMAFPWPIIRDAELANPDIVEDMRLGMDLAIRGHSPRFCASARLYGVLPSDGHSARTQRTRWEHGHLHLLLTRVPRVLWESVRQVRPALLVLALEASVPPLSLLVVLMALLTGCGAALAWSGGSILPAALLGGGWVALAVCGLVTWWKFGRGVLPPRAALAVPAYVLWKMPLYLAFLFRRERRWVRTARPASSGVDPASPAVASEPVNSSSS